MMNELPFSWKPTTRLPGSCVSQNIFPVLSYTVAIPVKVPVITREPSGAIAIVEIYSPLFVMFHAGVIPYAGTDMKMASRITMRKR
jgi:hypothetical protein